MIRTCAILFVIIISAKCAPAFENLTELENRISRQTTNTYTKETLQDSSTPYTWNPETLCYADIITGKEVWRLAGGNNTQDLIPDIGWPQYSADGSIIAFASRKDNYGVDAPGETVTGVRMVMNADGSSSRPLVVSPARLSTHAAYFCWSPVELDTAYNFGRNYAGEGANDKTLYKQHVEIGLDSYASYLVFPTTYNELSFKKGMSADGKKFIGQSFYKTRWFPATILPTASLDVADGYPSNRPSYDNYWGETDQRVVGAAVNNYHDQYLTGAVNGDNGVWFHTLTEEETLTWWKMRLTGTDADGGPLHISDNTYPYVWGGEMEVTQSVRTNGLAKGDCTYPNRDPWTCANQPSIDTSNYFSHYATDRWGKYILYSNTGGATVGTGIWDEDLHQHKVEQFTEIGGQHNDWHAWSDWSTSSTLGEGVNYLTQKIAVQNVNDVDSRILLCSAHIAVNNGTTVTDYNRLARPTQSPDGTKTMYHTTWMNNDLELPDIFYVVACYPYAPEITNTSATAGTVTIRFDWQNTLADPNPRTYTTRGWPSETTDERPIPRETSKYRLWRSTDKTTWTPITTIDADHFTRFDFVEGGFIGGQDSFWEITDTPGNGTFYYAVTSIENSGLESRTLSNIFSITVTGGAGTGAQDTVYPADPGGVSGFSTGDYDSGKHRYYNIYALDGSTPTAIQQRRVASDAGASKSWIDWLGKTDGTTLYTITAVDTQGNESDPLNVTTAYQQAPATAAGQYTVTWTDTPLTSTATTGISSTGSSTFGAGTSTMQ